ncbi:18184_t:CDS:2 [Gigaspora margarita]|uniref:18184_t:CDS:1 n=1 Tax=Gigaspora margarita TaxID=4874 RepID=A0ABN7WD75_GIGMA|nr:18184_t:CDS:2 [Gigaspora margarita]
MSKEGVQPISSWNNSKYSQNVRQAILYYYWGLCRLEEDEVIKRGRVALVKKKNRLCVVDIIELVTSRYYKEYTKLKTKIGNEEEIFDNSEENKKFAIFDNNIDALPDLIRIEFYLKKLIYILDAMFYDIELKCQQEVTHLDNCTYLVNNLQGKLGENKIVEEEVAFENLLNKHLRLRKAHKICFE